MARALMTESASVQPDDVRIIRALQIAPRASFAAIATVLGLTEGAVTVGIAVCAPTESSAWPVWSTRAPWDRAGGWCDCAAARAAARHSPTRSPSVTTSTGWP
ncbi:AsnC family protein [Streptomyces sp. KK5PA1]|uniref:AsnC family protein n=1 Tax=Actinacidiphila acididurans TaxID=2784346 RepID=A0ABS2TUI1_9ACTN|nr:AsnC family protein [Actinacidiphila acididurans]